jgi:hypothetical protein
MFMLVTTRHRVDVQGYVASGFEGVREAVALQWVLS